MLPVLCPALQDVRGIYYHCDRTRQLNERFGDMQNRIQVPAQACCACRAAPAVLRLLCTLWLLPRLFIALLIHLPVCHRPNRQPMLPC
jgi:hypothetical protein